MSRRCPSGCSRLTNGAPARVFHQGPQHFNRCTMTGCSLAVRFSSPISVLIVTAYSPKHHIGRPLGRVEYELLLDRRGSPCSLT